MDSVTPVADILTKIVSSPMILAIPIGAGVLVASLLGYFIFSTSQGKEAP